jgi:excisionase family DNA binding protein
MATKRRKNVATPIAPARLISAKDVAAILGVGPARVRELVRDGEIRSIRLGEKGSHRFRPEDVERFLAGEDPNG